MEIKKFNEFINEGKAYKITGISDKGMSLLNTIFKENKDAIAEIAKKHQMEKELEEIVYQISQSKPYYWSEEDWDWGEGTEED